MNKIVSVQGIPTMYSKCFGFKKVLLKYNDKPIVAFQEVKRGEILDEKWFNRFTKETGSSIYDVEIEVNTTNIKYYQNMKECEKNRYHVMIEGYYAEDIAKTMGVI